MEGDNWWRKIDHSDSKKQKDHDQYDSDEDGEHHKKDSPDKKKVGTATGNHSIPRYGGMGLNDSHYSGYEDPDKKPVKMTEGLKHLQDTRKHRVT